MSVSALPRDPVGGRRPGDRWGVIGAFLMGTFYLWTVLFLVLWVVVPSLLLHLEPVVVTSGSMATTIRPGDVVLLRQRGDDDLGSGTVITFRDPARPGTLTTHRIMAVDADGSYRTRGDANAVPDSTPVMPSRVVGVGRLLVPMVGLPVLWLRSGAVPLFVVWLLATVAAGIVATRPPPDENDGSDPGAGPDGGHHGTSAGGGRLVMLARRVATGRRRPGRVRAAAPTVFTIATAGVLARSPAAVAAWIALSVSVLLFDPRGPQIPVGRWRRGLAARLPWLSPPSCRWGAHRRSRSRVPWSIRLLRGATALALLVVVGGAVGQRSSAAFTGTTANRGNALQAAADFCTTPGATITRASATTDSSVDPFVDDTFVEQERSTTVNGVNNHHLELRSDPGKNARVLIRFALPTISSRCAITGATLRLWFHNTSPIPVAVDRLTASWSETTATWANQPAPAGVPVTATVDAPADGYVDLDVTTLAQDWHAGVANHGLVIRTAPEDASPALTATAHSKDKQGESSQWPMLVLTWG